MNLPLLIAALLSSVKVLSVGWFIILQGLIAQSMLLDRLLTISPETLSAAMKGIGAPQSETTTLNKALGKLRAWTESQMPGKLCLLRQALTWNEKCINYPKTCFLLVKCPLNENQLLLILQGKHGMGVWERVTIYIGMLVSSVPYIESSHQICRA